MNDRIIFQVPGILSGIKTLAHFWRITFDTQESISSEAIARFTELKDKVGWMTVCNHIIQPEDIIDLPNEPIKTVEPGERTPAQRLRNTLFVLYKQYPGGFKTDEEHYKYYMEKFIEHIKSKLDKDK